MTRKEEEEEEEGSHISLIFKPLSEEEARGGMKGSRTVERESFKNILHFLKSCYLFEKRRRKVKRLFDVL